MSKKTAPSSSSTPASSATSASSSSAASSAKSGKSLAAAPPTCTKCQKPIMDDQYQKVFTTSGEPTPYHKTCLMCVKCNAVIEDHYVWHENQLYHKACHWQKLIADATKQQQQ